MSSAAVWLGIQERVWWGVGALKAQLHGDTLVAEPIVYTLDEGTLSRYERRVLIK